MRQLCVINGSNKVEVEVYMKRINQFFVTRSLPQNELDFDIPVRLDVPEFSLIKVMRQPELFIGPNLIEVVPKVRNFGWDLFSTGTWIIIRRTQRKNHVKFNKKICELKIHANFGEF
jgi:hypothetical protein